MERKAFFSGPNRWFRDPFSGLSHFLGFGLAIAGLVFLLLKDFGNLDSSHVFSSLVYGASLILLYLISSLYHLINAGPKVVAHLRRIDHMTVYILIAGTYTPFCFHALDRRTGTFYLILVWVIALFGVLKKIYWMNAPRWISTFLYLAMGWLIVFEIVPISKILPMAGMLLLIGGGLAYSFGALVYAMKRPNPFPGVFGFHEIWHLFVLAGSAQHFAVIYSFLP